MRKNRKTIAILLISVGLVTAGMAASEEALNVDASVGALLDNPRSKEILDALAPGLSTDPRIDMAREMSLRQIVPLSDGKLTPEQLDAINDRLAKIK